MKLNYLSFISASQIFSHIVFKDVALTILRYNKFQFIEPLVFSTFSTPIPYFFALAII